ncbi:MAG: glycosyl transferase [Verrucomicrobia bacterium]|nr:MAG: glycosyl transferase [Verrucomicrobiota bacterium]
MISLTALVLTYNEQDNIRRNLEALVWVPKVIIVDSFSNDGTLESVRSFPNVQVIQRVFDTHANQWNAGLDRIDTEWTLTLDADYVLTAELQEEIKNLEPASDLALYWGDFDYCVLGRPLRAHVYPPRVVLFRTKRARYVGEGHTQQLRVKGKLAKFKGKIWHDDRKPLSRWFQSQERYAELEAKYLLGEKSEDLSRLDRLRKNGMIVAPIVMPIYLLLIRGLVFDGWNGWYYTFQRTIAEMMLALRLLEAKLRS